MKALEEKTLKKKQKKSKAEPFVCYQKKGEKKKFKCSNPGKLHFHDPIF